MFANSRNQIMHTTSSGIADLNHGIDPGIVSVELASHRTAMSFQRTRMSADNTLMSTIRTSLSLIGFGFTIFQFFRNLQEKNMLHGGVNAARHFGAALVYLGVFMLTIAIAYHLRFMRALRRERAEMVAQGFVRAEDKFPPSLTLIVALLLLFVGLAVVASLSFNVGPFG